MRLHVINTSFKYKDRKHTKGYKEKVAIKIKELFHLFSTLTQAHLSNGGVKLRKSGGILGIGYQVLSSE